MTNYKETMYTPNYVKPSEYPILETELKELNWLTKRTARHEYFMAENLTHYSYGNKGLGAEEYISNPFSPNVKLLMNRINFEYGTEFNGCFLNKYDDEHQHLGWHADDFAGMRHDQPIHVVSFGATREIWVKPKEQSGLVPENQRIVLEPGSMFVMPVGFQDTHFHRIPKHGRVCSWRISLTFRSFN